MPEDHDLVSSTKKEAEEKWKKFVWYAVAAVGIIGVGGYVYYHLSSASANDDNPSDKKVAKSPKSEYQLPEELVHSHGNEDVKYPEDAKSPLRRQNDDYSFAYEDGRRRTVEKKENKKKKGRRKE